MALQSIWHATFKVFWWRLGKVVTSDNGSQFCRNFLAEHVLLRLLWQGCGTLLTQLLFLLWKRSDWFLKKITLSIAFRGYTYYFFSRRTKWPAIIWLHYENRKRDIVWLSQWCTWELKEIYYTMVRDPPSLRFQQGATYSFSLQGNFLRNGYQDDRKKERRARGKFVEKRTRQNLK